MKGFILRFAIFMLPLAVLFLPVACHLERHREVESVEEMARGSRRAGTLIGLAYTDPMHLVKHRVLAEAQPRIIALGTSRVLPFRSFYFEEPERFYNCGRSVGKIQDLKGFLDSYPGNKPALVLLGLDQDLFGGDAGDSEDPPRAYEVHDSSYGTRLVKGMKAFYDEWKEDGLVTGEPMPGAESFFGRNARLEYEGYRPDGSYLYGRTLRAKDDYLFSHTISQIDMKDGRFAAAETIDPGAVAHLAEFLELCVAEGIHVVGFLPPYASLVYERLLEDRGSYPHVFGLNASLQAVFNERGYRLFDFTDLRSAGSGDHETYDGFHASETAYLRMIRIMSETDEKLRNELDQAKVTGLLAAPHSARQLVEELRETSAMPPGQR